MSNVTRVPEPVQSAVARLERYVDGLDLLRERVVVLEERLSSRGVERDG